MFTKLVYKACLQNLFTNLVYKTCSLFWETKNYQNYYLQNICTKILWIIGLLKLFMKFVYKHF